MVPGASGLGSEDWVTGIFGDGLVDRPGVYLALLYVAIALWIVVLSSPAISACAGSAGSRHR